jgi:hypothetical protein
MKARFFRRTRLPGLGAILAATLLIIGMFAGKWDGEFVRASGGNWIPFRPENTSHGEDVVGLVILWFVLFIAWAILAVGSLLMIVRSSHWWWLACVGFALAGFSLWGMNAVSAVFGASEWHSSVVVGERINPFTERKETFGWGAGLAVWSVCLGLLSTMAVPFTRMRSREKQHQHQQESTPSHSA